MSGSSKVVRRRRGRLRSQARGAREIARRAGLALLFASTLSLTAQRASGQDDRSVELAKSLYTAGVQAYSVGKYAAAIKAFEEAYRLSPRPTVVFSLAQAHRREYTISKRPEDLRAAIKHYSTYIAQVEQGGRRGDATEALAELEPLATRLAPAAAAPATKPPVAESAQLTQLMVSTSIKEAMVSLDGGAPGPVPFIKDVKPGKHKLKVTAAGHVDYERELDISTGAVLPMLDIPLVEKPARLTIECQDGAEVSIDGRLVATTPLLTPIEIASGRHFIAVTKSGHKPFTQDIDLKRGDTKTIKSQLDATAQRIASFSLLIGGTGTVALGAVLGILALGEQARAQAVLNQKGKSNITSVDLTDYKDAKTKRDDLRGGALAFAGIGTALGAGGLLLYIFDQPAPVTAPSRSDDGPRQPSPSPAEPAMDMNGSLVWQPGYVGGAITGRF